MIIGAGLLVATSAIHSDLWSASYRAIPVVGNLFIAQILAGVVIAFGAAVYRRPIMAVAGIGYMAATIGGLLVSTQYGLFGFKESLNSPFVQLTLNIEVAGIVAFAAALALAANARLAAGASTNRTVAATETVSTGQPIAPEPALQATAPSADEVVPVAEPEAAIGPTPLGGEFEVNELAVTEWERALGVDHPATLLSLVNLAYVYRSAGRLQEALAVQERVETDSQRIHGPKHPYTVTSQVNLAELKLAVRRSKGRRRPVGV